MKSQHKNFLQLARFHTYFADLFADGKRASYGHYCDENFMDIGSHRNDSFRKERYVALDVSKVYWSDIAQPSLTLLAGTNSAPAQQPYTLDPTLRCRELLDTLIAKIRCNSLAED
jgi:hypothetical protein